MSDAPDAFEMPVNSRTAFAQFLKLLRQDLQAAPEKWENTSLPRFLEAMQAYTLDIQGYYDNTGQRVDANQASWQLFADILRGAHIYE